MRHVSRSLQVKAAYVTTIISHLLRLSIPLDFVVAGHHTFHRPFGAKEIFSDP